LEQEPSRYERNPELVLRRVVDELVLIPVRQDVPDMDCIHTLNPVGALIWEKLDGHTTVADLQASIVERYGSDPQAVAADLSEFVQELESAGAVRKV
jgi:hypothetical protein